MNLRTTLRLGTLSTALLLGSSLSAQTLTGDVPSVDIIAGGTQTLTLSDPANPDAIYALAGSDAGSTPGFNLQGINIPLNPVGSYWLLTSGLSFGALNTQIGVLDNTGLATVTFDLPPGLNIDNGVRLEHAFVTLSLGPLTILSASNAEPVVLLAGGPGLVINEIDYDQPSSDDDEYIEIYNAGSLDFDLDNVVLELVNGNGDVVYDTIALSAAGPKLAAGEYLVVGSSTLTATLPAGTLFVDFANASNNAQNGSPDGARLLLDGIVLDSLSYEGDMSTTEGVGGAGTDDSAIASAGLSRFPNGTDTDDNAADFLFLPNTPGAANAAAAPSLIINEIDYDNGVTDTDEFIEIQNSGTFAADLTGLTLELIDGGTETAYSTVALSGAGSSLAPGGFLVVGSTSVVAGLPGGTLSIDLGASELFEDGAPDGARLLDGATVLDSLSYEGDMSTTEGVGGAGTDDGTVAAEGLSRIPSGTDTDDNAADFEVAPTTPGATNIPGGMLAGLVINEVDYDQTGTDLDEFVEIYNPTGSDVDLTNIVLELVNGNGDAVYDTIALSAAGATLPAGDYLVVGSTTLVATLPAGTLSIDIGTSNLVQNGAPDGAQLLDTGVVIDSLSYEGDMSTTEGVGGAGTDDNSVTGIDSLSRLPNGTDTDDNAADFTLTGSTPGAANA